MFPFQFKKIRSDTPEGNRRGVETQRAAVRNPRLMGMKRMPKPSLEILLKAGFLLKLHYRIDERCQ